MSRIDRVHRRSFLAQSAGIAVGVGCQLSGIRRSARAAGVNGRLNLGMIGLGGRGKHLIRRFGELSNVRIAALCDPDEKLLAAAAEDRPDATRHTDLRHLLDDRQVDAVVVATCNHWHALASIWACQAGKHVFVEKPLAHNHREGQQVVRAARRYERLVGVGTQQRSDPLQDEAKEYLHGEQALGPIQYVKVCRFGRRAPIGKRSAPLQPPASLDYNLWLGPALDGPIYRDKLHYDWHWDWNTGNGEMGNWGVHVLDDAINVALLDRAAFPKRVAAAGGRVAWDDAGQTPNVALVYYDTGSVPLLFALSNLPGGPDGERTPTFRGVGSGYVVHCEGGYYAGRRGGGAAYDRDGNLLRQFKGDAGAGHYQNFVDAVFANDRNQLNTEVQLGHQSTAWCNLADVAVRVGGSYARDEAQAAGQPHDAWGEVIDLVERHLAKNRVEAATQLRLSPLLEFDPHQEQFTGPQAMAANLLLRREYRQPFDLPAL